MWQMAYLSYNMQLFSRICDHLFKPGCLQLRFLPPPAPRSAGSPRAGQSRWGAARPGLARLPLPCKSIKQCSFLLYFGREKCLRCRAVAGLIFIYWSLILLDSLFPLFVLIIWCFPFPFCSTGERKFLPKLVLSPSDVSMYVLQQLQHLAVTSCGIQEPFHLGQSSDNRNSHHDTMMMAILAMMRSFFLIKAFDFCWFFLLLCRE